MTTKQKQAASIGQQLLDEARKSPTHVKLTDHYWGSVFGYSNGVYYVRSYRQGFGGMKSTDRTIKAREISSVETIEMLSEILNPTCDVAEGDPQNYAPRNVLPVPLTWEPNCALV